MSIAIDFLERNFQKLPKWARVTVYFVALGVLIYLLLVPRFINGQIVAVTKNGGMIPYRGVDIQMRVDGRTMKYQTNEDGYWSVPVISRIPESVRLQVFHQDDQSWYETTIAASDIWKKPWSNEFRITILRVPPSLRIENIAGQLTLPILNSAVAGELALPSNVQSTAAKSSARKSEIDQALKEVYLAIIGKKIDGDIANVLIGDDSKLDYVERIQFIQAVENSQQTKIPDRHWKFFRTLGELSDYLYKRKLLEASDPQTYRLKDSYDWGKLDNTLPRNQRPVFVQ